jgi:phage FluMu gp28-like protein
MTWAAKTQRCQFLVDNLDLPAATGYDGARWEHFQLAHLQDDSVFRNEVKSRQIAWSWLSAAEAVADGILNGTGSVFVSINLDEAKEKIRYAKNVIGALPKVMRPALVTDNRTEIEFANGARLISLPATAPRGKAQMNVYLDEFAHVRDDVIIYTAALPMISKGNRRLRMASSPMGASGRFWEVATESFRQYPGYSRKRTPWWEVQAFCTNVREARQLAPTLATAERVDLFGKDRIKAIFANLPLEDFEQEYECVFVDESTAWITWEEIAAAQAGNVWCELAEIRGDGDGELREAVNRVAEEVRLGRIEAALALGVDVGRTRNTSEIYAVGLSPSGTYPLRMALTLDASSFETQRAILRYVFERLPIVKGLIDQTGLGRNLAEDTERAFPVKAEGVNFTAESKLLWSTDAKMLIQQGKTPIPNDRDIAYQIHSIKRMVTPSRNVVFDAERNAKYHADKYWAWVLALAAARGGQGMDESAIVTAFGWRA